ncbi:LysR family transcriptional regulator [Caballeronia novacaledonica]|uniref:LysR family transcriptional regulator n=1 Tax=Caballeronia novacaledonica TaxID=1544861 RepID=A0A2U3HYW8_9BURK|nr:LysR family transcriptional regulator [Caballeronia novacaledonica]
MTSARVRGVLPAAGASSDSEVISHKLGETFSILCASPDYIRAREWTFEGPAGRETLQISGTVQVNIAESLVVAIREGMGIGMLPLYAAIEGLRNGSLVRVLPRHTLQRTNLYALYALRKFVDAKTRTWVEFLRAHLPDVIARDEAWLAQVTQTPSNVLRAA